MCYQEFIPHRKKYGNNSVLRSHPPRAILYIPGWKMHYVHSSNCPSSLQSYLCPPYVLPLFVFEWHLYASVSHHGLKLLHTHVHIQAVTVSEYIRVHVEVLPFLCAMWSNLWTALPFSKTLQSTLSLMPNLWLHIYENAPSPHHIFALFFLYDFLYSHSCHLLNCSKVKFPWAIIGVNAADVNADRWY